MNLAYTKLLKIRGRLREFNFRKKSKGASTCHVDCTDERGNRFLFTMVRGDEGGWQLAAPDLPAWIVEAEDLIATAITEEEAPR
jgi:hypothetical protein